MFNSTVEHTSLAAKEKETFSNSFLSNQEFFPCRIWANLPQIKRIVMDKIKVADQVATMARDQK